MRPDIAQVTGVAPSSSEKDILERCGETVPVLTFPLENGTLFPDSFHRTEEMSAPEHGSLLYLIRRKGI